MVRLGQVVDGATLRCLLQRLVTVAASVGVTKGRKMRVDTTVVEAPIHHPTDSGLCEDVIRVLVMHERQRWFKRERAWRAGGEARISRLKNTFGMQRSPYRGRTRRRSLHRMGRHRQ